MSYEDKRKEIDELEGKYNEALARIDEHERERTEVLAKIAITKEETKMMWKKSPLQKYTLSPIECEKAIKEDYGIDLRKEFPPKLDMRSYRR